jgi:hypothetical protein
VALTLSSPALEQRARLLLERVTVSGKATWRGVFAVVAAIYLVTSHWWTGQNPDSVAAAWPAWQFVHHGTFDLSGVVGRPDNEWFLHSGDQLVSNRMPGVVLAGVPANVLLLWTRLTPEQIGALAAAVISAAAIANIALLLRQLVQPRLAIAVSAVLAFGTGMWTVASAELWTHGPDAFWLSLGLLLFSRGRYLPAGLALAPLVLTRPHLAVVIAVLGLWEAADKRSLRPCLALGVPASVALATLVLWNRWLFGDSTLGGGGYTYAASNAARSPWAAMDQFGINVAGTLFSGWCGALLFTPALLVLALAMPHGWRVAPPWARAALAGGIAYQVIQFRINSYTGGGAFFGNRLILEFFVLATPLAALGYAQWSAGRPRRIVVMTVLSALSIAIHGTGAVLADYRIGGGFSDWTAWYPVLVVRASGISGVIVVSCTLAGVALAGALSLRSQGWASAPAGGPGGRSRSRPSRPWTGHLPAPRPR